jgi:hypothetical protein
MLTTIRPRRSSVRIRRLLPLIGSERAQGWLGWAALVLGIGLFVPFVGFLALLLSGVWFIVMGVVWFRVDRTTTPANA